MHNFVQKRPLVLHKIYWSSVKITNIKKLSFKKWTVALYYESWTLHTINTVRNEQCYAVRASVKKISETASLFFTLKVTTPQFYHWTNLPHLYPISTRRRFNVVDVQTMLWQRQNDVACLPVNVIQIELASWIHAIIKWKK